MIEILHNHTNTEIGGTPEPSFSSCLKIGVSGYNLMIKIRTILLILTLLCMLGIPVTYASEYRLGPGDILTMTVWNYQQADQSQQSQLIAYAIRPDGCVAFPLVGEVKAEGMTPAELTAIITKSVGKYIKDPKVTLNVEKFRTVRVYVLGEIAKPGLYEIERQHRLLDAIGLAGSYTKSAAKKKIFIYHKDQTGDPIKANLLNLLNKGDMTQNYELVDGDVVYLSDNGRIDFSTQILPVITGLYYTSIIDPKN